VRAIGLAQPIFRAIGLDHIVPAPLEQHADELDGHIFIVDNQDLLSHAVHPPADA